MPQRSATFSALALVREAIATTGKSGLLVGGEMALGHDHAGADAADLVARCVRTFTSGSNSVAVGHLSPPVMSAQPWHCGSVLPPAAK